MEANYILTEIPEVVDGVLRHLPMQSLNKCSRVCRSWSSVVSRLKKQRNQIEWMLKIGADCLKPLSFENLMIEPDFALVFEGECLSGDEVIWRSLKKNLPENCRVFQLKVSAVIGTDKESGASRECENQHAVSCLFFPKRQDLQLHSLRIRNWSYGGSNAQILSQIADGVPPGMDIRLALALTEPSIPYEMTSTFLNALLSEYPGCVVAGGIAVDAYPPWASIEDTVQSSLGLVLCGDQVRVASCIINVDVHRKKEMRKAMAELKKSGLEESGSFAFMFSCVARGSQMHGGRTNVESAIFRELFPQTPLFGFFGNGEYGHHHIPAEGQRAQPVVLLEHQSDIEHSYTTVFVLVSYV